MLAALVLACVLEAPVAGPLSEVEGLRDTLNSVRVAADKMAAAAEEYRTLARKAQVKLEDIDTDLAKKSYMDGLVDGGGGCTCCLIVLYLLFGRKNSQEAKK